MTLRPRSRSGYRQFALMLRIRFGEGDTEGHTAALQAVERGDMIRPQLEVMFHDRELCDAFQMNPLWGCSCIVETLDPPCGRFRIYRFGGAGSVETLRV